VGSEQGKQSAKNGLKNHFPDDNIVAVVSFHHSSTSGWQSLMFPHQKLRGGTCPPVLPNGLTFMGKGNSGAGRK